MAVRMFLGKENAHTIVYTITAFDNYTRHNNILVGNLPPGEKWSREASRPLNE